MVDLPSLLARVALKLESHGRDVSGIGTHTHYTLDMLAR
jgi:hypothetical protein